jgi:2-polyprenyl-6-methoxyphenol hydroxylase-like FAD-dependent oxidoreductase
METSIIGGGIGGMTLALSLLDAGIDDVDIYESATGFSNLDDIVSQQELEEIARTYKRTAGFDPETLNRRPSLSVRRASARAFHVS